MIGCNREISQERIKCGFIRTCSKKCGNAWSHLSWKKREEIIGKNKNDTKL